MKISEFLLWPNCSNNCKFCHQKKFKHLTESEKIESVKLVYKEISEADNWDRILLVGGELFDVKFSNELDTEFFKLIDLVVEKAKFFNINTNLIYKDLSILKKVLDIVKNWDAFTFTTSYDFDYRFNCNETQNIMLENIKKLKNEYPCLKINVNTILTDYVCEQLVEGNLHFPDILDAIFYIPVIDSKFMAPNRNLALKALSTLPKEYLKWLASTFSEKMFQKQLFMYINNKLVDYTAEYTECSHNVNMRTYTKDTEKCFICDIEHLSEI